MAYTDPTESIYRIVGEYLQPYSATVNVPYNIANLRNSGSIFYNNQKNIHSKSAENYERTYEVVSTFGRRDINVSRIAYPITQSISRIKLNEQTAYTMPARTSNENVIAVIFSAPGGSDVDANGQRDIEGEEYSSNNSMNMRNYSARKQLNDDYKIPLTASSYRLHGTHRNSKYRISSASLTFETKYDNGFVVQMLPFHIDQVPWISQSLMKNDTQKKSHYIYFNEQTGSEYIFTSTMTGSELTKSWGTNYFGIYGYPTWLQTRAGDNWRHKAFAKRSYYYVNRLENIQESRGARRDEWGIIGSGTFDTSSEGFLMFKEPIIDYANELSFIRVKDPNNNVTIIKTPVYKSDFYNEELNNIYGISESPGEDALGNFVRTDNFSYSIGKKYQIYPSPKVSGFNRTRQREDFIFKSWRDDSYRTQSQIYGGALTNAENVRQVTASDYAGYTVPSLYAFNYTGSIWPLDMYVHPTMYQTGGKYVAGELMLNTFFPEAYTGVEFATRPWYSIAGYRYHLMTPTSTLRILPWTAYLGAMSTPFKDRESVFSLHTSRKYKNYTIVPEFNVSNKITTGNLSQLNRYLYDNSFVFENTGSYIINQYTDSYKINNTLQFNIDAVTQLRPYEKFYPCNATLECAKYFSASLASVEKYNNVPQGYGLALNFSYVFLGMAAFFNPGILYGSIKAGIPMPCNFAPYLTTSAIFEFNDIFDPYNSLRGKTGLAVPFTESLSTELYSNAITNFLKEVKHTFCKNNTGIYFESKRDSDYKVFTSGTTYIMDITLDTGKLDISSSNITNSGTAIIGGVNYIGYKHNLYATMVPPWWPGNISSDISRGVGIARITFTPTLNRKYTLDEILSLSTLSFHRKFDDITGTYQAYPKLTSSFDLFEKHTDDTGLSSWRIKSKWEFPYLVMTGALDHFSNSTTTRQIETTWPEACVEYAGGLWHDFCEVPRDDQGIFLSLKNYDYTIGGIDYKSASLADMVGFTSNTRKRVGELNTQQEISELICIVPINKEDDSLFVIDAPNIFGDKKSEGKTDISNISEVSDTYFKNVQFAEKYILPPKLDPTVVGNKPILMFCTEVIDTWSRRDLSYIWQNVLPQNGLRHSEKNYIYKVTEEKDLAQLNNKNVYFMIFKCKRRSVSNPIGTYGYNWPWDMCSLCDLLKIELVTESQ